MREQESEREREREREREGGRERDPWPVAPFLYVILPSGPALCKLGKPGVLFFLPEVLTLVLRPSFVLFLRAFSFLVF